MDGEKAWSAALIHSLKWLKCPADWKEGWRSCRDRFFPPSLCIKVSCVCVVACVWLTGIFISSAGSPSRKGMKWWLKVRGRMEVKKKTDWNGQKAGRMSFSLKTDIDVCLNKWKTLLLVVQLKDSHGSRFLKLTLMVLLAAPPKNKGLLTELTAPLYFPLVCLSDNPRCYFIIHGIIST